MVCMCLDQAVLSLPGILDHPELAKIVGFDRYLALAFPSLNCVPLVQQLFRIHLKLTVHVVCCDVASLLVSSNGQGHTLRALFHIKSGRAAACGWLRRAGARAARPGERGEP